MRDDKQLHAHPNANPHSNTDSNTNADSDSNTYSDAHADSYPDTNAYADTDSNSNLLYRDRQDFIELGQQYGNRHNYHRLHAGWRRRRRGVKPRICVCWRRFLQFSML
jgi:hypothetical protein